MKGFLRSTLNVCTVLYLHLKEQKGTNWSISSVYHVQLHSKPLSLCLSIEILDVT